MGHERTFLPRDYHDSSWRHADFKPTLRTSFGTGKNPSRSAWCRGEDQRLQLTRLLTPIGRRSARAHAGGASSYLVLTTVDLEWSMGRPGPRFVALGAKSHSLPDQVSDGGVEGPAGQLKPTETPDSLPTIRDGWRGRALSERINQQSNPVRHLEREGRISTAKAPSPSRP